MFSECEETPGICSFMITLGSILIGKHTKTEKLWMFSLEILLKENLRIDLKLTQLIALSENYFLTIQQFDEKETLQIEKEILCSKNISVNQSVLVSILVLATLPFSLLYTIKVVQVTVTTNHSTALNPLRIQICQHTLEVE